MDPFTALGVAAAVVQFTDFAIRLIQRASAPELQMRQEELEKGLREFAKLTNNIKTTSNVLIRPHRPLRPAETTLVQLCEECDRISSELPGELKEHWSQKRSENAIVAYVEDATLQIKSKLKVDNRKQRIGYLRKALSETKENLIFASFAVLWEEATLNSQEVNKLSRQQASMVDTLKRIDHTTRGLHQDIIKLSRTGPVYSSDRDPRAAVVNAIWGSKWTASGPSAAESLSKLVTETDTLNDLSPSLIAYSTDASDTITAQCVLRSIAFETLNLRHEAIPEAHQQTYDWIFEESDCEDKWDNFPEWLRGSGDPIYWVTGKAGSGKSTLLKYISNHAKTRELVQEWSGSRPLIFAAFYFWNAGTAMQRSQEGLLRTLLYQFLEQMPHLTPIVCPRRWAIAKLFGDKGMAQAPQWTWTELHQSFSVIASDLFLGKNVNMCLFLDGLDEFEGDLGKIIEFIQLFSSHSGVKICASSRQWNEFSDAFGRGPSLLLHVLTHADITTFTRDKFQSNQGFLDLQQAFPEEADAIMSQVVHKAEGIFLWVAVVMGALLERLTEGETLRGLQETVDSLPADLSELFDGIWSKIKPTQVPKSSQIFQVLLTSKAPLDALTVWLTEDDNALDFDYGQLTLTRHQQIIQLTRRRLNARTKGLVEISLAGDKVNFMHRTVRDWILPKRQFIFEKGPPTFDANLMLLKANTSVLQGIDTQGRVWETAQLCLLYASEIADTELNVPLMVTCLDQLHKNLTQRSERYFWQLQQRELLSLLSPHAVPPEPMLYLAAQYAVMPYLRHKVLANPSICKEHSSGFSILDDAVFGFLYDCPANPSQPPPKDYGRRHMVTELLMENGALEPRGEGRQRAHKKNKNKKCAAQNSYERVCRLSASHSRSDEFFFLTEDGKERLNYFDEVRKLFEKYGSFGQPETKTGIMGVFSKVWNSSSSSK
ncbi:hypothetical protein QBC38DRAFT_449856 [Podospora fimiseda]|uniref:NACHT domain-containing protein n=1 Tax=Podospora fimiseda TaxID=252190 RepID=A0AAN7BE61_9PEZI|nr:hypothetical protein QBC38DRAFT_449856 [Podospora fimiseda]